SVGRRAPPAVFAAAGVGAAAGAGATPPRTAVRRAGAAPLAGAAVGAASDFASPGTRRLTFSTTTDLVRPWLKLCFTTPCSMPGRLSDRVPLPGVTLNFSPGFFVSVIPIPVLGPLVSGASGAGRPDHPSGNAPGP